MERLDQFDFHERLAETAGPVLVLFTAPACGACRRWRTLVGDYARAHGVGAFEVDVSEDLALARAFEVFHLPAVFLYRDGDFHCALQCPAAPDALARAVARALAAPAEEAP